MKVEQNLWTETDGWGPEESVGLSDTAQLVLIFGSREILGTEKLLAHVSAQYPQARLIGCSTAGEIRSTNVLDNSMVVTAMAFEHTEIRASGITIEENESSRQAGERLIKTLPMDGLQHVFLLSDGLNVNGSDLVDGITSSLPGTVSVTGGLSGDGSRFENTLVLLDGNVASKTVIVVGFYGERLKIGYGSLGGWDSFGPERLITRADGNILFELDGRSALELYKKYLGEHAEGLPATGLLFPLSIRSPQGESRLVRTILSVDEKTQSMTFAGDLPEGSYARLMKANFNRLIDGAAGAAKTSNEVIGATPPDLAILISCVGRKMVLKQRIEDEVEAVRETLGQEVILSGFYSYGEISPSAPGDRCQLHNQTMTITTLREI